MRKTAILTIISLRRVLSTVRPSCVTNTVVPSDRGKLVTLVGGVCVQHSSEMRIIVLLWPFVADDLLMVIDRHHALHLRCYLLRVILIRVTSRNIQWHETSRGLSATAELLNIVCLGRHCSDWGAGAFDLHWLPVQYRITYKLCLLMHCIHIHKAPYPISKTLSLRQHQSVFVDGFGQPAVPATSSHGWDSNLVSAVSRRPMLHQPPGTLYCHHCNNSLTPTHLNCSFWTSFFLV